MTAKPAFARPGPAAAPSRTSGGAGRPCGPEDADRRPDGRQRVEALDELGLDPEERHGSLSRKSGRGTLEE